MAMTSPHGVILREAFLKARRKWISHFICANLVYIIAIAGLLLKITEEKKIISSIPYLKQIEQEQSAKDKLYGILRTKGYSLGQGIDIAEAIVTKSRELELPLSLILAVIDQESEFYPNARSIQGAQGLMQIMPLTWDKYILKLNLGVDRKAITDPFMNITVGCQILKDLYDQCKVTDHQVRMTKALTDYNNGELAPNPNLSYAIQVHNKQSYYEKKLR